MILQPARTTDSGQSNIAYDLPEKPLVTIEAQKTSVKAARERHAMEHRGVLLQLLKGSTDIRNRKAVICGGGLNDLIERGHSALNGGEFGGIENVIRIL